MPKSTRTFKIGDGSKVVDLPDFLHVEYEQDDTLLAYPPKTDFANLRFTSLKISGATPGTKGEEYVRSSATQRKKSVFNAGRNVVLQYDETSKSGNDDLLIKYWIVGLGDSVVIVSCTLDVAMLENPLAVQVQQSIPEIVHSIRFI